MTGLEIEAIYVDGMLRLPRRLPLTEGQTVTITIHPPGGIAARAYGRLQTRLSQDELQRAAMDPEFGILEGP
jgi:predicted DNA-binding antitoxin AbrB/MazE fold protein